MIRNENRIIVETYHDASHDRSTENILQAVSNSNEKEGSNDIEEAKEHSEGSILSMVRHVLSHASLVVSLWIII